MRSELCKGTTFDIGRSLANFDPNPASHVHDVPALVKLGPNSADRPNQVKYRPGSRKASAGGDRPGRRRAQSASPAQGACRPGASGFGHHSGHTRAIRAPLGPHSGTRRTGAIGTAEQSRDRFGSCVLRGVRCAHGRGQASIRCHLGSALHRPIDRPIDRRLMSGASF